MSRKPFSLKMALIDIGAAVGGAIGVSALMRRLSGTSMRAGAGAPDQAVRVRSGDPDAASSARTTNPREAPRALDARPATPAIQPRVDRTGEGSPPAAHPSLPRPTYWPAALAFGITLIAWGFVTTFYISLAGVIMLFLAIGGWIGELLHEH